MGEAAGGEGKIGGGGLYGSGVTRLTLQRVNEAESWVRLQIVTVATWGEIVEGTSGTVFYLKLHKHVYCMHVARPATSLFNTCTSNVSQKATPPYVHG